MILILDPDVEPHTPGVLAPAARTLLDTATWLRRSGSPRCGLSRRRPPPHFIAQLTQWCGIICGRANDGHGHGGSSWRTALSSL